MSKKLVGLLLALCLVVGLLPVTALAANGSAQVNFGFTKVYITGYDAPVYYKNASAEAKDTEGNTFTYWYPVVGTETDWNAKFEWKSGDPTPTLTLNGFRMDEWNETTGKLKANLDGDGNFKPQGNGDLAVYTYALTVPANNPMTIVLTGEDSYLGCKFGLTYYSALTIKSEGNTKLVVDSYSSGISSNQTPAPLTINANLDVNIKHYPGSIGAAMIQTHGADLTINGGNITVDTPLEANVFGITTRGNSGNLIINGGTIKVTSATARGYGNGAVHSAKGKVVINGGDLTVTPKDTLGIYGSAGVEINGGTVTLPNAPYYGVAAGTQAQPGDVKINGGTFTFSSAADGQGGAFLWGPPILGDGVDGLAGTSAEDADFYDDTKFKVQWMQLTSGTVTPPTQGTEAPTQGTEAPTQGTEAPTQGTEAPTQGTQAPTQGTEAPTQGTQAPTQGNDNPGTGDNGIVMFSALLLVAVFGIVATVAFSKKNSIVE